MRVAELVCVTFRGKVGRADGRADRAGTTRARRSGLCATGRISADAGLAAWPGHTRRRLAVPPVPGRGTTVSGNCHALSSRYRCPTPGRHPRRRATRETRRLAGGRRDRARPGVGDRLVRGRPRPCPCPDSGAGDQHTDRPDERPDDHRNTCDSAPAEHPQSAVAGHPERY